MNQDNTAILNTALVRNSIRVAVQELILVWMKRYPSEDNLHQLSESIRQLFADTHFSLLGSDVAKIFQELLDSRFSTTAWRTYVEDTERLYKLLIHDPLFLSKDPISLTRVIARDVFYHFEEYFYQALFCRLNKQLMPQTTEVTVVNGAQGSLSIPGAIYHRYPISLVLKHERSGRRVYTSQDMPDSVRHEWLTNGWGILTQLAQSNSPLSDQARSVLQSEEPRFLVWTDNQWYAEPAQKLIILSTFSPWGEPAQYSSWFTRYGLPEIEKALSTYYYQSQLKSPFYNHYLLQAITHCNALRVAKAGGDPIVVDHVCQPALNHFFKALNGNDFHALFYEGIFIQECLPIVAARAELTIPLQAVLAGIKALM